VSDGVAPQAAAGWAARADDGRWELSVGGSTESFFDLASLTKPMTAIALARARIPREAALADLLAESEGTPSEMATLELLLAHRAGLEANLPLFRIRASGSSHRLLSEGGSGGARDRREALVASASARRADAEGAIPREGFAPVYSDLGYILAGEALTRRMNEADCGDAIGRFVVDPLGLRDELGSARALAARGVDFDKRVVPTEVVAWRGGEVRGKVHDENAWALAGDGACGHAGMFGTVRAVLDFGAAALDAIARGEGRLAHVADPPKAGGAPRSGIAGVDLSWLVKPRPGGSLRAGFDGKSEGGGSTAGELAGPRTFGHLGFTGTSLWIDPDAAVVVVLLTNRVHPTRDNLAIRAARPAAHDALFEAAIRAR
jgi:CubicO group peptidase (beta-lactamase class C family)